MKVRWPFFVLSLLALTTAPTESVEPSAIVIASTLGSEVQPGKYISTVPLDILFSQANLAYQLKEYEQSQKLVEQYLKRFPAMGGAHLLQGMNLLALDKEQQAEATFQKALDLAQTPQLQGETVFTIGKTYYYHRDFEKALHYFNRLGGSEDAILRQKALYYRGLAHFELSNLERAESDFEAASYGPDIKLREVASTSKSTVEEKSKTLAFTAGYRFFYDDNVVLLPRQGIFTSTDLGTGNKSTSTTGKESTGQVLFGEPELRWGKTASYTLRDNLSWGYHFKDHVRSFDYLNNTASFGFRSDKNPYFSAFFYSLQQHTSFLRRKGGLNILSFILEQQIGSDLWMGEYVTLTPAIFSSVGNFHDTQITPPDDRDAITTGGDALLTLYYLLREAYVKTGFTYRYNFARGKNYDWRELGLPIRLTLPLIWGTDLSLGAFLFWRDFTTHRQGRKEKEQTLTAGWVIPLNDNFLLNMNLLASFVDSTNINFDYERRVYSASFSYTF